MEIARLDTPLLKRVPTVAATSFATTWARLLDAAVESGSVNSWSEFFMFPKCMLWSPMRGGWRVSSKRSQGALVLGRLARWPDDKAHLWQDAVARSQKRVEKAAVQPTEKQRSEARIVSALRMGDVRKALQMLISAPIAPKTDETLERLRKLHPSGPPSEKPPQREAPRFKVDVVRAALSSFGPCSAAGLFGYKPALLQQCARAEGYRFAGSLTSAVNLFASGRAPDFLRRFIAGGVSIALEKNATSVRPLACGDPLRRLVAKCFCIAGKKDIETVFKGRNYGVGCPGGVEVVAHSLRDTLHKFHGSDLALLKIDFRNAFNEVGRPHFVSAACDMFPAMSSWTDWCYGTPTMLLYDHNHIESEAGVQQGDPLGPLYFCCGIMPLVNEINALNPVYNKWYMDDGGIVADVPTLLKVWDLLKSRGPALGLHLNPAKCEWSWLNPDRRDPCPIRLAGVSDEGQVKLVPHAEIQMLGVPLGGDTFVGDFVGKKLLGRLQTTISKLVDFEDSQSAFYLLRVSFSIVRAVHFMRTTPLCQWRAQAVEFDAMLRKAAEDIFGFPMSDFTYAQAALTPKLGGLGLRKATEHAGLAFSASWHEAKKQSMEDWKQPPGVGEYVPQKSASFAFDEKVLQYLVDRSDTRNAQRLRRAAQPHAGGFITAVPSEEDGNDTVLRPRNFRVAVAYRLGVPLLKSACKPSISLATTPPAALSPGI